MLSSQICIQKLKKKFKFPKLFFAAGFILTKKTLISKDRRNWILFVFQIYNFVHFPNLQNRKHPAHHNSFLENPKRCDKANSNHNYCHRLDRIIITFARTRQIAPEEAGDHAAQSKRRRAESPPERERREKQPQKNEVKQLPHHARNAVATTTSQNFTLLLLFFFF